LLPDECRRITNQKDGGNRNQRRVISLASTNEAAPEECDTSDVHATVMCYTAATGDPVMCVIILQGESKHLLSLLDKVSTGLQITMA